jgi:hypothetical protein
MIFSEESVADSSDSDNNFKVVKDYRVTQLGAEDKSPYRN